MGTLGPRARIVCGDVEARVRDCGAPRTRDAHFLAFTRPPRAGPANLLARGRGRRPLRRGRPIELRQSATRARAASCWSSAASTATSAPASRIEPLTVAAARTHSANVFLVPNLDPDGAARDPAERPRRRPQPQLPLRVERDRAARDARYPGPRPFSEPETRLAARIVALSAWRRRSGSTSTAASVRWSAPGGRASPRARLLAKLARIPFRRLPWPAGTAPTGRTTTFRGSSSYVVELPPGRSRRASVPGSTTRSSGRALEGPGGRRLRCPAEEVRLGS